MFSDTWTQWLHAYCRIRGYSALDSVAEGFFVEVGRRQQAGRYFLPQFDETAIRRLLARIDEPMTYVEMPAPREMLARCLPDGWRFGEAGFLMGCDLQVLPSPRELGQAYSVETSAIDNLVDKTIRTRSGALAARGTCLTVGDHVIFDQICTEPAHRRRGLGAAIVTGLAKEAGRAGASAGSLVATPVGRKLYEALGWEVILEVSTLIGPGMSQSLVRRIDRTTTDRDFCPVGVAA